MLGSSGNKVDKEKEPSIVIPVMRLTDVHGHSIEHLMAMDWLTAQKVIHPSVGSQGQ